jgi:hypothetical protein
MPAFTFEKLSPPVRRDPTAKAEEKQRSLIVQLLGRLTRARTKRSLRKEDPDVARGPESSDELLSD